MEVSLLEAQVDALVALARDRGATSVQRVELAQVWVATRSARLAQGGTTGADAARLGERVERLALDLLRADGLLLAPNAPYGGHWQPGPTGVPDDAAAAGLAAAGAEHAPAAVFDIGVEEELRASARAALGGTANAVALGAGAASDAATIVARLVVIEEAARALLHAPLWSTLRLLPFLDDDERDAVVRGTTTWTLAEGPLVADLDTAERIAVIGGDTVWELDGAERELLASLDETRPLGVVVGGGVGRALFASERLPALRTWTLTTLAWEAVGVARRSLELRGVSASHADAWALARARALARWAAASLSGGRPDVAIAAAAAKATAADIAVHECAATVAALGGGAVPWESPARGLHRRALWIRAWEASGDQLHEEVAAHLLDDRGGRDAGADDGLPAERPGDPPARGAAVR